MKVFSVFGITQSGKTTTIENIIKTLKKRRYTVGSVKEIHFEKFAIDTEGSNTDRHRKAGAELVTARGYNETDVLFPEMLPIESILKFYDQEFVVLEGVTDANVPKIITAHTTEEIDERLDGSVFAVSGRIAAEMTEYKGLPVINSVTDIEKLADLIEEKVFEKLPDFPAECCSYCGYSCRQMTARILRGDAKRSDCVISQERIELLINNKKIEMVPFVQKLLLNSVEGVVKELDGYKPDSSITVKIRSEG